MRKSHFNTNIEEPALNEEINIPTKIEQESNLINSKSPLVTDIRKKGYFERDPSDTTSA